MDWVPYYPPPKHPPACLKPEMNMISIGASRASRSSVKVKEISSCTGEYVRWCSFEFFSHSDFHPFLPMFAPPLSHLPFKANATDKFKNACTIDMWICIVGQETRCCLDVCCLLEMNGKLSLAVSFHCSLCKITLPDYTLQHHSHIPLMV